MGVSGKESAVSKDGITTGTSHHLRNHQFPARVDPISYSGYHCGCRRFAVGVLLWCCHGGSSTPYRNVVKRYHFSHKKSPSRSIGESQVEFLILRFLVLRE